MELSKEECVLDTGQRSNADMNALLVDAQTLLKMEKCALGMGQRSNDAAIKDAQIKLSKEEYA